MITNNKFLNYPEVKALEEPPACLIVLLHGVGSNGDDLIGLVPLIQRDLPDCHFISPHGVEAFDMAPYGRQWFSLLDRDPLVILSLIEKNVILLGEIISKKQQELGITNSETILLGFSQGTMMALYLNLIQTLPFQAVIGFSGKLIKPKLSLNFTTPICLIHGDADTVVTIDQLDLAHCELTALGIACVKHNLPNLSHSIDVRGLNFAINFIKHL